MGEMADYTLELAESEDLYFDNVMYEEETDSYIGHGHKRPPTCKYCGKKNLTWGTLVISDQRCNLINRWFLHESTGEIHDCPKNPLSVSLLKKIVAAKKSMNFPNILEDKWMDVVNCKEFIKDSIRLTKEEYGCLIALAVSSRSEDPHTKAGCCILNAEGRIVSTGYNGLPAQKDLPKILLKEEYRDIKRNIFIHAETNALSLICRGEGHTICLNMNPCLNCAVNIVAHGIKNVVYVYDYNKSLEFSHIFQMYGVSYRKLTLPERKNINNFTESCIFIRDENKNIGKDVDISR